MKKLYYLLLILCTPWIWACQEDVPEGPLPTIRWEEPSGRFRIQTEEALTLVPQLEHTDNQTTYTWTMDGRTIGSAHDYTFCSSTAGTFFLELCVTNRFGKTADEIKITVSPKTSSSTPDIPEADSIFRMHFAQTDYHISLGRTVKICPAWIENGEDIHYEWTIDGVSATETANGANLIFNATDTQGKHLIRLTAWRDTLVDKQEITLEVCPPEGTYRRETTSQSQASVNKVYAYRPAPGFMVNGYKLLGRVFPEGCTHTQACDTVCAHLQRRWLTSLGAWGGYLIAGFDHSVANSQGDYDLCIKGNPYSYQSEPGLIWVSQDENGDGLPNDTWYELAGSEYGTDNWEANYALTYYRPAHPASATGWRDSKGETGYVPYMSYWNPEPYYWQDWMEGESHTFYGSKLKSHHSYENGISDLPSYPWGYADNEGSDHINTPVGKAGLFKIAHARDAQGQAARLAYIDFVKVQTAQTGSTPNLGEISTEVYYIGDYHLMK